MFCKVPPQSGQTRAFGAFARDPHSKHSYTSADSELSFGRISVDMSSGRVNAILEDVIYTKYNYVILVDVRPAITTVMI